MKFLICEIETRFATVRQEPEDEGDDNARHNGQQISTRGLCRTPSVMILVYTEPMKGRVKINSCTRVSNSCAVRMTYFLFFTHVPSWASSSKEVMSFAFVCLSVSWITQKVVNAFW